MTKVFILQGFVSDSRRPIQGQIGNIGDLDGAWFYLDESVWYGGNPKIPFQLFNRFPFIRFKKRLFLFNEPFYFQDKNYTELRVKIFNKSKKTREVLMFGDVTEMEV